MKVVVCIKQVPAKESMIRLNEDSTSIRESDLSFEINEPDAYALEEALRLKEKRGGEVVVCSVGPARVQQIIREAIAKGADRGIHIEDDPGLQLDSRSAARLLAEAIRREEFDLIFTGLQSDDLGMGQTGVILAELLGLPHATIVIEVQVQDSSLKAKKELEGGWFQWVEMPLPTLLTIQSGINKPRYATLLGIKKAKTKEIRRFTPADLGFKPEELASQQELQRIYVPVKTKQTEFIQGSPKETAATLVNKLQQAAGVL